MTRNSDVDEVAVLLAVSGDRHGKLTRAERLWVTRILTARGESTSQIAERVGCTERSIVRYRRELGISQPVGGWRASGGLHEQVVALARTGMSSTNIARLLRCNGTAVRRHRRLAGLNVPAYVNTRYRKETAA